MNCAFHFLSTFLSAKIILFARSYANFLPLVKYLYCFSAFAACEVSILAKLTLGQLRYLLAYVPPHDCLLVSVVIGRLRTVAMYDIYYILKKL